MIFGYVGICYKEAPLALRGQVALPDSKKIELWERLSVIGLKQCVIVSTCNRSEIFYFSSFGCGDGGAGAVLLPGHFPECFVWGLL